MREWANQCVSGLNVALGYFTQLPILAIRPLISPFTHCPIASFPPCLISPGRN